MTDPLKEAIQRAFNMAKLHGTSFTKITYDAEADMFRIVSILPEFITVSFEKEPSA